MQLAPKRILCFTSLPMNDFFSFVRHIQGHDAILESFGRTLAAGRLAHASLFAGPEGVGKRTTALALAAYLLRDTPHAVSRVTQNIHPDCLLVDTAWGTDAPSASIRIEAIRQLEERLMVGPFEGTRLVVILDPADAMTDAAANALLKTLEEPPPEVYFFLITAAPYQLPATIRSRCRMARFAPLSEENLRQILQRLYPDRRLDDHIGSYCDGSIGRAVELLESELHSGFPELARRCRDLCADGTLPELFDMAEAVSSWERESAGIFLLVFLMEIRDAFVGRTAWNPARNPDLAAWMEAVETARRDIDANVNRRIVLENLFWKLRRT